MLRYLTSGESHGKAIVAILEGIPSGMTLYASLIDEELARRQRGYGRGARMKIEKDRVAVISGVRRCKTLGSPIALLINNLDWKNWADIMSPEGAAGQEQEGRAITRPRPGHADLPGGLKYGTHDLRNILERSSARETAARVAVGAVAKRFLEEFGIKVYSWVIEIGGVRAPELDPADDWARLFKRAEASDVRCPDKKTSDMMRRRIDEAKSDGDSLGGVFEVVITGAPPGLGSHVQWDRKLDGRLAQAVMSIQAIKGVEVGMGFDAAVLPGSKVHDEIFYGAPGAGRGTHPKGGSGAGKWWPISPRFFRTANNAGGIEGGMSNGEPIRLSAVMKPIPTLYKPLRSVDISTKRPFIASVERSDVTAVPAAAVIAESVAAIEMASQFLDKFGGDSIIETGRNYRGYLKQLRAF